ncbi:type 1 fimbrial protein [Rahnella sp. PD12R]|uniref:fimbrial protein n=1 Tax=Rahnella sp. PD12R TaxID=2855688 RepID=UPI001C482592|nr:fimbrial protein [Rahnella sp. PD12R]MBV6819326.1 type 1 fimbrial protein [Rahnella sp. PD12R]
MSRQKVGVPYFACVMLTGGMLLSASCAAADNQNTGAGEGDLQIHGALMEAPCLLDMRSEFQDVKMDSSVIAHLHKTGDTGQPVQVTFRLLGCFAARAGIKEMPVVSFQSPADPDEPTLLSIGGVSGIGLRILDEQGRQVMPGERHQPQFSSDGGNTLVYNVVPVRTRATLTTGRFQATVDFRMNYE